MRRKCLHERVLRITNAFVAICCAKSSTYESNMTDVQGAVVDLSEWQLHHVGLNVSDAVTVETDEFGQRHFANLS